MGNPCDRCQRYLLCNSRRACVAWLWWFSARWRELTDALEELDIEEDDKFGEWWE